MAASSGHSMCTVLGLQVEDWIFDDDDCAGHATLRHPELAMYEDAPLPEAFDPQAVALLHKMSRWVDLKGQGRRSAVLRQIRVNACFRMGNGHDTSEQVDSEDEADSADGDGEEEGDQGTKDVVLCLSFLMVSSVIEHISQGGYGSGEAEATPPPLGWLEHMPWG